MTLEELLKKKKEILEISKRHGATNIRVFGSVARKEAHTNSDIDLLIELEEGRSLFDRIQLTHELEDLLGCKVDIVSDKGLYWYLAEKVRKEAILL